jgi:hypothetical protein
MSRLARHFAVLALIPGALILGAMPARAQIGADPTAPSSRSAAPPEAITTASPVSAESAPATSGPAAPPPEVTVQPVSVTSLAAPDAFSTAGRDTGLPSDLWRGTPVAMMKAVLPMIAARPLSPAAAALARRVLATGASGPEGTDSATDGDLVGLRATALLALGDVRAAATILQRAPGVDRSSSLSRAAAESALLVGDDMQACTVADALTAGRGDIYWLRLRTYCQALAGQTDAARLTFDLAQAQAKDPVFARLMGARLAGGVSPGAASLRNGLDLALSRSMNLDLTAAKPAPAVAAAIDGGDPAPPLFDKTGLPDELGGVWDDLYSGKSLIYDHFMGLMDAINSPNPKVRARAEAALLLAPGLEDALKGMDDALISTFTVSEGRTPIGRNLVLQSATARKNEGEAALLVLWTSAEAGVDGPSLGDRVRIVAALHAVGLETDARNFALEGLAGLK